MTDEQKALAITLAGNGMTAGKIAVQLGATRNTIIGVIYRARQSGVIAPLAPSPERGHHYNYDRASTVQLCFAAECFETPRNGRFCDAHVYRPRPEQPLSRLMGARA